jgi:3-isopropylmalate/(R)-2-methylmalate dehydratase large subunit
MSDSHPANIDSTEPRTLFDILWSRHVVTRDAHGKSLIYVDRAVIDDVRAPFVFANLKRRGLKLRNPQLALLIQDHAVPTFRTNVDQRHLELSQATRDAASEFGVRLFDVGDDEQGISHVAAPESGFVLPGSTYVSVDSHAPTVGGLGALGFGCGSTEMEHVLATQTMWMSKPMQARVTLAGQLSPGVTAKDIVLSMLARFGRETFRGVAMEFAGSAAELDVEGRMTLCNMAVEAGARTAIIAPDEKVLTWLSARAGEQAIEELKAGDVVSTLRSGERAIFDIDVVHPCPTAPQITWGVSPAHTIPVDEVLPPVQGSAEAAALAYMNLVPGERLLGKKVDYVFIGSCTNGRFDDLVSAASILDGRSVPPGVRAVIVPGSRAVERQAADSGVKQLFLQSGFVWGEPGCSMCAGGGEQISPGARVVSTTNRNFPNRQGPGVRTHLASPLTAAACALAGAICDPRSMMRSGER